MTQQGTTLAMEYLLHSLNIVILAESHDPTILKPSVLADRGIVPTDWKVVKSENSLIESTVQYEKVVVNINPSRLEFIEGCESPFRDEYSVYGLVDAYLSAFPYVPYKGFGINHRVYMDTENPEQWIRQHFLRLGSGLKILSVQQTLDIGTDDGLVCRISVNPAIRNPPQGDPQRTVIFDSNIHHPDLDADEMRVAISRWPEKQAFVISVIDELLKGEQV